MKIGSRSLLFGAHQFLLHPVCVALAWRKLYGRFPGDPRIWIAFVVHDWGYWGCPNMDGAEGKMHPWRAARWFAAWFDKFETSTAPSHNGKNCVDPLGEWGRLCLFHSRSLARRYGEPVSQLCAPDKIASFMVPRFVYLTGTRWSGELAEYMAQGDTPAGRAAGIDVSSPEAWFGSVKIYLGAVALNIVAGGDPGIPPGAGAEGS